jgi:quinol monooxygenase YgiN
MSALVETRKKFILGWMVASPGKRDEFMALAGPYRAAVLQEPGVVFFEIHASATDPNLILIVECFETPEAHDTHLATPNFAAMWKECQRLIAEAKFEDIYAASLSTAVFKFDAPHADAGNAD